MKRVELDPRWFFFIVLMTLMSLCVTSSSAGFFNTRHRRRSSLLPISSVEFDRVGSSILLPVHGNVYPIGFYNVTMNIGQPARPYFLDPDTGSDLTWLQCDAPCVSCTETPHPLYRPSSDLVPCRDPLCKALYEPDSPKCENSEQCDYEVEYADGGSSLGVLLKDSFSLNFTNGAKLKPRLAIGCGYDQIPGSSQHPVDGVLGLGRGKASIVSQLNGQGFVSNVVGHCLSRRGGGFLFFGDGLYDPSRVTWAPMSQDYSKHYSPGYAELIFDGNPTGARNLLTVFDSGSSYTYINSQAYQALTSLMRKELPRKVLREAPEDKTLPLCWRGKRAFKSVADVRKYFKPLAFDFIGVGKTKTYDLLPEDYLIISSKGSVCLGILNGTEVGLQNANIIGDVSMQDRMVIYDNEKNVMGWVPSVCDKPPKTSTLIF